MRFHPTDGKWADWWEMSVVAGSQCHPFPRASGPLFPAAAAAAIGHRHPPVAYRAFLLIPPPLHGCSVPKGGTLVAFSLTYTDSRASDLCCVVGHSPTALQIPQI